MDGSTDGLGDGCIETLGANEGETERAKVGEDGAKVGVRERGSELHVGRPEPTHAGYTQAGVKENDDVPNVIPAQYSMIAISSALQVWNAPAPIDITLLGILTDVRELQP